MGLSCNNRRQLSLQLVTTLPASRKKEMLNITRMFGVVVALFLISTIEATTGSSNGLLIDILIVCCWLIGWIGQSKVKLRQHLFNPYYALAPSTPDMLLFSYIDESIQSEGLLGEELRIYPSEIALVRFDQVVVS